MRPNDETNENLEVMRNSGAEAAEDPLGELHAKLDMLLSELRALRADVRALREPRE